METPRRVLYVRPSSIITVNVGSRRRLTAFCDLALVSNQISPSSTPYHIATRCGRPLGSTVASVAVRLRSMNSAISASDITIFVRSFLPTLYAYQAAPAAVMEAPSAGGEPAHQRLQRRRVGGADEVPCFGVGDRLDAPPAAPAVSSTVSSAACRAA